MNQPIPRHLHGIADYAYVVAVAAAPALFEFEEEKAAAALCRIMSGGTLVVTLLTRAEWGLVPAIPYRTHLASDFASGVLVLVAPWLFGFHGHRRAWNAFLAIAAVALVVPLLSKPDEMPPMPSLDGTP